MKLLPDGVQHEPTDLSTEYTELKMMAVAITVSEPVTLRRFGLRANAIPATHGVMCRMALFENATAQPYQLRIPGPLMELHPGDNEGEVPRGAPKSTLKPGQYWLAAVSDARFRISSGGTSIGYYWMNVDGIQSAPATFDVTMGRFSFPDLACYLVVEK